MFPRASWQAFRVHPTKKPSGHKPPHRASTVLRTRTGLVLSFPHSAAYLQPGAKCYREVTFSPTFRSVLDDVYSYTLRFLVSIIFKGHGHEVWHLDILQSSCVKIPKTKLANRILKDHLEKMEGETSLEREGQDRRLKSEASRQAETPKF